MDRFSWLLVFALSGLIFAVWLTEVEELLLLRLGDPAPQFPLTEQDGTVLDLPNVRFPKNIVIFFYPKDFSPGCTQEACAYRDAFDRISRYDAILIGVSGDNRDSHLEFSSAYRLSYSLVSDSGGSIGQKYGVRWLGGVLPYLKRVSYVIDKGGIIRGVFWHEFGVNQHIDDVLGCLAGIDPK